MPRRPAESVVIARGTKNVFADLGYPDAAERQAKLRLAYAVNQVLEQRELTQTAAAAVLGLTSRRCLLYGTTSSVVSPLSVS